MSPYLYRRLWREKLARLRRHLVPALQPRYAL